MAKNEKPLVLVADDEPSTLALVANHLRSRGYRVIEATDGDEAWNAACRELPDIVVLDVMMPGMSGWEVCRKIREAVSLAHTGVLMLTGIGDTLNELTSPLYGADAYLDKPFQFSKLAELVESTLAQRSGGKLGRPKKTSGPATRLWKTSLGDDEEPRSERRPKTERAPKKAAKKAEAPAKKGIRKKGVIAMAERAVDAVEDAPNRAKAAAKKAAKFVKKAQKDLTRAAGKVEKRVEKAVMKVEKKVEKAVKKAAKKAVTKASPEKAAAKKTSPKKAAGKKTSPKKAAGKKTSPKKAAKKAAPKAPAKPAPKKPAAKKGPVKKAAAKPSPKKGSVKSSSKKAPSKKGSAKASSKKAPSKKTRKK